MDFRELVRVLASVFRTRIELRQGGVRDEARLLGGVGICGRELCCNTYLSGFAPVSIKMAKEQNLSLNPTKISGVCGRLMCCLVHEEETYEYLNRTMPRSGDFATNVEGQTGTIRSVNILKQSVLVIFEDGDTREMKEYPVAEVGLTNRRQGPPSPEAVQKIQEELEEKLREKLEAEIAESLEEAALSAEEDRDFAGERSSSGGRNGDRSRRAHRNRSRGKSKGADTKNGGPKNDTGERQNSRSGNPQADGKSKASGAKDGQNRNSGKNDSGKGKNANSGKRQGNRSGGRSQSKERQPEGAKQAKDGRADNPKNRGNRRSEPAQKKPKGNAVRRNGGYSRGYRTDRQDG